MTDEHTYTYDLATFSAEGSLPGPAAQTHEAALDYLTQRMADQHRGGLTTPYWRRQAALLLREASEDPGVARSRPVLRGRGVSAAAFAATPAAAFSVELFPLFDDDGPRGPVVCAAAQHPRLAVAMREAGIRAESWLSLHAAAVAAADERGPVVGFEAVVDGRLLAPLRSASTPEAPRGSNRSPLQAA